MQKTRETKEIPKDAESQATLLITPILIGNFLIENQCYLPKESIPRKKKKNFWWACPGLMYGYMYPIFIS